MLPLKITVRSIKDSPVINFHINKHFLKLSKQCRKIHACHVVIDTEQKHGLKGKLFSVHIELAIPGKKLVSKKRGFNLFIALRDAFTTLENNLVRYRKRKVVQIHKHADIHIGHTRMKDDPVMPEAS